MLVLALKVTFLVMLTVNVFVPMSFTRGSAQKMNECHIVRIWSKRTVTFVNISQTVLKIFYPKHYTIFNYFTSPCVSG